MWTLLLSRLSDPPGVYFDRRQFDGGEISIGRSAKTCDIVLPNDDGLISRTHCTISAIGLDLFVTDQSTNGVALNDPAARILPRQPVPIRLRDRLIIHAFVITVVSAAEGASAGLAVAASGPEIPDAGRTAGDDIWGAGAPDPFWQGGGGMAPGPATGFDGGGFGGSGGGGFGAGGFGTGEDSLVHDFLAGGNAFLDSGAAGGFGAEAAHHPSDFGFSDGLGEAFSRPIMAAPAPASADMGIPEDWLSGPSSAPVAPDPFAADPFAAAPAPAVADPFAPAPAPHAADPFGDDPFAIPAAKPQAAFDPFAEPAAIPAPPPPPPAPVARSSGGAPDWARFYEGAGLSPEDVPLDEDALFKLGQMYRQMVLGLCDILQDRAAFKDEFRVERTQLSIGRNNPLKHLPAIEVAKVLLGKPLPGFMGLDEALRTSLEDLKKHQLAMLAGVQNALLVVFDRLAPAEIERFAGKVENQKRTLLGRREPDKWAVYMTVFEALRRDATGNANGVMSVAFREGYENFMRSVR